jgi:thiol-disulfide isomerase/thioredoxin
MIRYLILILFLLPFSFLNAQLAKDSTLDEETMDKYYERMRFAESRQPDSAIYYARIFARQSPFSQKLLLEYIHGFFAEEFLKHATQPNDTVAVDGKPAAGTMRRLFLDKMVHDTSLRVADLARPLALWVKALDSQTQPTKIKDIVQEFLDHELNKKDMYFQYRCRYALLTWQLLIRNGAFDSLSASLFNKINARLTPYLTKPVTASQSSQEVRTICIAKYQYASARFIKAQSLIQQQKTNEAMQDFRLAFKYSPDNTGLSLAGNYAYDMLLLFGAPKMSFREDYLNFLSANNGSKEEILSCLSTMTMIDPSNMQRLKDHYKTVPNRTAGFDRYWMRFLSDHLDSMRGFSIKKIDGSLFASANQKNKWTIVYFWGTWCGPCKREMPQIEAFYRNEVLTGTNSFELLTIACHDQEATVKEFMKKNNYTFPVAMSDNKVPKLFPIPGYPTKILITPNGRYQVIPFGQPWQDFVKNYSVHAFF